LKLPDWFIGRFRGKDEYIEYSLEELDAILKKESYSEAAPILKDIYASFDNIRRIALEIKELECPKDVNPRVKTVIRTAKPEFVREVLEELKVSNRGAKCELKEEKTAIEETMEMLAKAVMGPGKYLHMAFPESIDKIRKELKRLAVKKKELEDTANTDDHNEDTIKGIYSLKERLNHKNLLGKEREDTANRLKALENEEKSLMQECTRLEEGNEYSRFLEKKELLEKIKCEKEEKENLVYNLFTPLRRPLKMLRKSLEEKGKTEGSLKEMERISDDPVNFLCSSESKDFMKVITSLKKNIYENPDIKPEEKNRVKQRISAIEGADLEKIRQDISDLKKHAAELTIEISRAQILDKKTENEKEIYRIRRDAAHIRIEIARIGKKIEKDSEEIEILKKELEKKACRLKNGRISVRLA